MPGPMPYPKRPACKAGHEFTPENTHQGARGRECRACKREWSRAQRLKPLSAADQSAVRALIQRGDGCWLWLGSHRVSKADRRPVFKGRYAYVVIWEMAAGKPHPEGLEPDHLCRNPLCVRPSHLEWVTHRENILRGESPMALQAKQTVCVNGHSLANPVIRRGKYGTKRECRTCCYARNAERRKAKRAA